MEDRNSTMKMLGEEEEERGGGEREREGARRAINGAHYIGVNGLHQLIQRRCCDVAKAGLMINDRASVVSESVVVCSTRIS